MKKFLVTIAVLGFGFSAQAAGDHMYEIQINGGFLGTSGQIEMNDEDWNGGAAGADNTPWSVGAEVYKTMGEKLQIGGGLRVSDNDNGGDTIFTLAALSRYNFDSDFHNSMFAGLGFSYTDLGPGDSMALHLQFGKRYSLSENITYTPNLEITTRVAGDADEGMQIAINLLSFSGFM